MQMSLERRRVEVHDYLGLGTESGFYRNFYRTGLHPSLPVSTVRHRDVVLPARCASPVRFRTPRPGSDLSSSPPSPTTEPLREQGPSSRRGFFGVLLPLGGSHERQNRLIWIPGAAVHRTSRRYLRLGVCAVVVDRLPRTPRRARGARAWRRRRSARPVRGVPRGWRRRDRQVDAGCRGCSSWRG